MIIYIPTLVFLLLIYFQRIIPQSIPAYSKCSDGESAVFLMFHNKTVGKILRKFPANNLVDCTDRCRESNKNRFNKQYVRATLQNCLALAYTNGVCRLSSTIEEGVQVGDMIFTKNCVRSERICSSAFHFDAHEQKILVGFAREVVSADTLSICLTACLNAFDTFGFECESVMFYPVDSECILNTEDRLDRPDLFIDEYDDTVVYLDNNCAGSQCYAPYITQYISVRDRQLMNELDHHFVADLNSCESLCTNRLSKSANIFNCKSFMHNEQTNECILSDERSKPLGRAALAAATGFNYYEKKCFASPRTCRNTPSFMRIPQMILVGFAAFVMENVPSVTMCLDQCTNPPPETGKNFLCKSVMYYYNEQECILNAETRLSKPDLFIPEGEDFQVDYFDINCHLEQESCPAGTSWRAIRTLNAQLPVGDGSLHVLQTVRSGINDCLEKCHNLAPDKCRSLNFDKQTFVCDLMYVDGKTTLRPTVQTGVDLYDLHCLHATEKCLMSNDSTSFSRYLYTKQSGNRFQTYETIGLDNCLDHCTLAETCEGVNYNRRSGDCDLLDNIGGHGNKHEFVDFYKNLCRMKEVDSGLSAALNVPTKEMSSRSDDKRSKIKSGPFIGVDSKVKPLLWKQEAQRRAPESRTESSFKSNAAKLLNVPPTRRKLGPPVLIPAKAVQTICNYEGMKVQIKNSQEFSGVMFVRNQYDTCRVEISDSKSATLVLGLPHDFGSRMVNQEMDESILNSTKSEKRGLQTSKELRLRRQAELKRECGIQDMLNGTYKSIVVVQTNNLGIPGIITSMDQLYEISCDYRTMLGGKVMAAANLTIEGPEATDIQPKGKIELGNPVLMQMLSGGGKHQPILQAKLGDILELRWEIVAMDEEIDFSVRDCYAEPGREIDVSSDEKLQLIENGCPTPAVAQKLITKPIAVISSTTKIAHLQAFRFDSSSSVRITCHLDICLGKCKQAECRSTESSKLEPLIRSKRGDDDNEKYETSRYRIPRKAHATTSLMILDPLQQVNEQISFSRTQAFDLIGEGPSLTINPVSEQMCMAKPAALATFGFLFTITTLQALIVARHAIRRIFFVHKLIN